MVNTADIENFDKLFPIIDLKKISGHRILHHDPTPGNQQMLMADIIEGIRLKLPAFRVPCMDPSVEDGKIVFKLGNKPAIGYWPEWWDEKFKQFNPEKNSRIGNRLERAAYLGTIIMILVDEKHYSVETAWKAACNNSSQLGNYIDSNNAKCDIEPTGSCKVGSFFDLANVNKIIKDTIYKCYLLVGGSYNDNGWQYPLVEQSYILDSGKSCYESVGWLVFDV